MEQSPSERVYPEHIYDPLRRRIAAELVEKELLKAYPSISSGDLADWQQRFGEHDFWGAVDGVIGATLLKPILLHFLTARNFQWEKRDLRVEEMQLSSKLDQLNRLGGLDPDNLLLSDIKQRLQANPSELAGQKKVIDTLSQDSHQNEYPIIVRERQGQAMVLDGNRRALRALLNDEATIETWYCVTGGQEPRDYWYPIDDMMRLVRLGRTSESDKDHVKAVLAAIFSESSVAKTAYMERIVKFGTRGASELL